MHCTIAKHCDFWSQKDTSGGLNVPDEGKGEMVSETSLNGPDEVTMGEMVSETSLFQTACFCIQNKANKQRTGEM